MIELDLYGDPIPQKRPKFFRRGDHVGCYDDQIKLKQGFQWQMKSLYRGDPLECPLSLQITFFMPIPKSTSKVKKKQMINGVIAHIKRPDLDNLQKFLFDCMNGLIFKDDSQIVAIHARKIYAENPGTFVRIFPLADTNESLVYENLTRTDGRGNFPRASL